MNKYEEGMKILNERFGNGKDNVISLATISLEPSEDGGSKPCVRDVDALYENGTFYIVTYANTNKVKQIEANREVAVSVHGNDVVNFHLLKHLCVAPGRFFDGKPILQANGKTVLRKSCSILQDDFFQHMRAAGYTDVERGERDSTEEHLTVTQFKVAQEKQRLEAVWQQN